IRTIEALAVEILRPPGRAPRAEPALSTLARPVGTQGDGRCRRGIYGGPGTVARRPRPSSAPPRAPGSAVVPPERGHGCRPSGGSAPRADRHTVRTHRSAAYRAAREDGTRALRERPLCALLSHRVPDRPHVHDGDRSRNGAVRGEERCRPMRTVLHTESSRG